MSPRDTIDRAGAPGTQRGSLFPEALLVVVLAALTAWVVRALAPPSLIRDGKRLPVAMAVHDVGGGHNGSRDGGLIPPSPIADEPVPHLLGEFFLAAHVLAVAMAVGVPLIHWLLTRFRWNPTKLAARLTFALFAALASAGVVVLAARLSYGDGIALDAAVTGGAKAARYSFAVTLAVGLVVGLPWRRPALGRD